MSVLTSAQSHPTPRLKVLEQMPSTYGATLFPTQSFHSFHSLYSNPTASPSYLTNSPLPSFHVFSQLLLLPFQPAFLIKLINASSFVQPCSSATLGRYVAP